MLDLFSSSVPNKSSPKHHDDILGLIIIEDFISDFEHDKLLVEIDKLDWSSELKRRVQHYGYKYNYKSRTINSQMKSLPFPKWAIEVAAKLEENAIFKSLPDQLIINEYLPGQGISSHIDCEPCFSDIVVSISLNSTCIMKFSRENREDVDVILKPKSAIVLTEDARYKWKHSIPSRKSDDINGKKIKRSRRLSLTYRQVIISK